LSGTLLIPQEPFELLVRRSIGRLTEPSLQCKVGGCVMCDVLCVTMCNV
jgi:hypothetical protein